MPRALYRSRQVWHALRPHLLPDGLAAMREILNERQQALFFAMQTRDQRHAIEVMTRLREHGVATHDLLVAALLHDCGKGAVPVWLRIAKVLAPSMVRNAGSGGASGWRGAAYRLTHHAIIGAELVAAAGASETTVRLIAGRVEAGERAQLQQLQAADDAS